LVLAKNSDRQPAMVAKDPSGQGCERWVEKEARGASTADFERRSNGAELQVTLTLVEKMHRDLST
jgi:hypothetical protein